MNEQDIINYLKNPNTTKLQGFIFRLNYSELKRKVTEGIQVEKLMSMNSEYTHKRKYFDVLFRLSVLFNETDKLRYSILIDPKLILDTVINKYQTKLFNFNSNQLIVSSEEIIIEIECLDERDTFIFKIYSLNESSIIRLKSEIEAVKSFNQSVISNVEECQITNTIINTTYILNLLNLIMEDYHSPGRTYSLFSGITSQNKNLLLGMIKTSNLAFQKNEDCFFVSSIAQCSLFVENRLADIYERENGSYNDDKTLGQLIGELKHAGHLNGIDIPLERFKDIRNNLIHYHRRTFNLYNSFIETISYFGQFLIWCEDNGYL